MRADVAEDLGYAEPGDLVVAATSEHVEDVCKAVDIKKSMLEKMFVLEGGNGKADSVSRYS